MGYPPGVTLTVVLQGFPGQYAPGCGAIERTGVEVDSQTGAGQRLVLFGYKKLI